MRKVNKKKKKKFSLKKWLKGFTLVELLAVIVILAIIMIIAIPNVLDTMNRARRKTFIEYVLKVSNSTEDEYMKEQFTSGNINTCFVYDITKDLSLPSTGDYKGYTIVNNENDNHVIYITLYDKEFMVYGVKNSQIDDIEIQNFTNENDESLTKENLAGVAKCSTFTYKDRENPTIATGTASQNPTNSQPKGLLTGTKRGENNWVGVYNNGDLVGCYSLVSKYIGDPKNNFIYTEQGGTEENYCTTVKSEDPTVCEANKSIECCTGSQNNKKYYALTFSESPQKPKTCGIVYIKSNPTVNPDFYVFTSTTHTYGGGNLPEHGVYEE